MNKGWTRLGRNIAIWKQFHSKANLFLQFQTRVCSLRATKRGFCHFSATTLSWWLGPILFIVQHSLVGCDIWVQSSVSGCFHSQSVIRWHGPSEPQGLRGQSPPRDPICFSKNRTKTSSIIWPFSITWPPRFSDLPTALRRVLGLISDLCCIVWSTY